MGSSFQDSKRYASVYTDPKGPGDDRPTSLQIIKDNGLVGKLKDKTVLLTGGSNGLGVDEVRNLSRTGAKVFFTSRDLAKGERVRDELLQELKGEGLPQEPKIEVIKLDLESVESIKHAADEFTSKSDQLSILVNNAGIANSPFRLVEGYESQFWVDHIAHFYLFHLLKPLLLKSSSQSFNSRVVSVSSLAHTLAPMELGDYSYKEREYDEFTAYARAKTANIWFANELERRYGSEGLHATSVHPGGITGTGLQQTHSEKAMAMMEQYLQMPHIQNSMMNVEQGSATIVLAAVGKEYEGIGGFYMENCGVSPPLADAPIGSPGYKPWAYDEEGEKQLWLDSLEILKLKDD